MGAITTSGISGIDVILRGGFLRGSAILVEGAPGTGKSTLGMQFLHHGAVEAGEPGIYITFEEFPQQLYRNMMAFGWDLKELERQKLLRVVSMKPDVFYREMKTPDGLFDTLVGELHAKRIVLDSISLFHYLNENAAATRQMIYTLCNVFRKHGLTALLLSEQIRANQDPIPFEHYVVDGIIRLALEDQMEAFRKRTLEVTKMRGCRFMEGKHIYRIAESGIHLVPALTMVEDGEVLGNDMLPTGIGQLDKLLQGGIPQASAMILDANSKANYKYIVASILASRIKAGDCLLMVSSHIFTIAEQKELLKQFGVDLAGVARNNGVYFIEYFERSIPKEFEHCVIDVKQVDNADYDGFVHRELLSIIDKERSSGGNWFVYLDLGTVFTQRGSDFVRHFYSRDTALFRSRDITTLALCNFAEVGGETASFLERATQTVVRTWVDRNYQYLQVTKSATGRVSIPMIVQTCEEEPYIRLV